MPQRFPVSKLVDAVTRLVTLALRSGIRPRRGSDAVRGCGPSLVVRVGPLDNINRLFAEVAQPGECGPMRGAGAPHTVHMSTPPLWPVPSQYRRIGSRAQNHANQCSGVQLKKLLTYQPKRVRSMALACQPGQQQAHRVFWELFAGSVKLSRADRR